MTRLWGAPLVLALVTAIGLVSALLGDGAWDVLSWLTLAAPIATMFWYARPRRATVAEGA